MRVREAFSLSHGSFVINKKRNLATVILVGLVFGMFLASLLIMRGEENVKLKYSNSNTDGKIYVVADYEDGTIVADRINKYNGEIMEFDDEYKDQLPHLFFPTERVARFDNFEDAYGFYLKDDATDMGYDARKFHVKEIISDQIFVYEEYRQREKEVIIPIGILLFVAMAIVMTFTIAHTLMYDAKTFILYRSIGASKGQILMVYLFYLIELCAYIALFAIAVSVIVSLSLTLIVQKEYVEMLIAMYPKSEIFSPILMGVNWNYIIVIVSIFLIAPLALALCVDQFNTKKIALKLKDEE